MSLSYYFLSSKHRRLLDKIQESHKHLIRGSVIDIGGRDRGRFLKPKKKVKKWVFADINPDFNPDIVLDVTNMAAIKSGSFDTVLAMELFEHVDDPEAGINECFRILKQGGLFILSMPFLYPVHSDPYDFQRWSDYKLRIVLDRAGFKDVDVIIVGRFFSVLYDMFFFFSRSLPFPLRYFCYLFFPFFDLLSFFDRWLVGSRLGFFHGGYFVTARKR